MSKVSKKLSESEIEKKVVDYAKRLGWQVRKINSINHRGMPDRLLMGFGRVFFIEFKRPGGKPSKLQTREMQNIKAAGLQVYVVDDIEQGKRIIDQQFAVTKRGKKLCKNLN